MRKHKIRSQLGSYGSVVIPYEVFLWVRDSKIGSFQILSGFSPCSIIVFSCKAAENSILKKYDLDRELISSVVARRISSPSALVISASSPIFLVQ
jgi:hypothetical protein